MNKSRKALLVGGAAVVSLIIASPVLADEAATGGTASPTAAWVAFGQHIGGMKGGGIAGTISAISGSTVTVTGKDGKSYTVDASGAVIHKDVTAAVTDLKVGDAIAVAGTTSGTSVTAKDIQDGFPTRVGGPRPAMPFGKNATFGSVASVSGSTFTITRKSPTGTTTVTVTTDASTVFKKNGQADTLADITTGQMVVVMGTKDASGNVAATSVNVMVPRTQKTQ